MAEGPLQLIYGLSNFRMLTNLVLQSLQQAMGSGDMLGCWRIGAWFRLGFHEITSARILVPTPNSHVVGDPFGLRSKTEGVSTGPWRPAFRYPHRLNPAAGAGCGAVQRGSGTGEVELAGQRPALQKSIDKSGVEDVAGAGGVQRFHLKCGSVVEA